MTIVALALLVVATPGAPDPGATGLVTIEVDRPSVISGTWGKADITVVIHAREWSTRDLVGETFTPWPYGDTVTVIQAIEITFGKRPVFVPRSCFADLLNVRTAELRVTRSVVALVVHGGDASESFEAHIEFDRIRVKRRRVLSPIAEGPGEETIYYRRVLKDVP